MFRVDALRFVYVRTNDKLPVPPTVSIGVVSKIHGVRVIRD